MKFHFRNQILIIEITTLRLFIQNITRVQSSTVTSSVLHGLINQETTH